MQNIEQDLAQRLYCNMKASDSMDDYEQISTGTLHFYEASNPLQDPDSIGKLNDVLP